MRQITAFICHSKCSRFDGFLLRNNQLFTGLTSLSPVHSVTWASNSGQVPCGKYQAFQHRGCVVPLHAGDLLLSFPLLLLGHPC